MIEYISGNVYYPANRKQVLEGFEAGHYLVIPFLDGTGKSLVKAYDAKGDLSPMFDEFKKEYGGSSNWMNLFAKEVLEMRMTMINPEKEID